MKSAYPDHHPAQQRAAVVVLVAVCLTVIIGFAALAFDLGRMYVARAELQRAADAAALAGVSSFFCDVGLSMEPEQLHAIIVQRTQQFSLQNPTFGAGTILDPADIVVGTHDFEYPHTPLDTSGVQPFNAVQVTLRRTPESFNGPVLFFFARLFGKYEGGVCASATAAVDDRFSGFRTEETGYIPLLPFTLRADMYEDMLVNGNDDFSYDDRVYRSPDGVPEVDLYPWKLFTHGQTQSSEEIYVLEDAGQGNFGILGLTGGGASSTADRVLTGIPAAELEAEIGTPDLPFYDDAGDPLTYQMSGEPGVAVSIAAALEQRLGDVVGFFVHDTVSGTGSNAEYRIVGVRFGRIMDSGLRGNPFERHVVIQPTPYTGPEVVVHHFADPTDRQLGRIMLVK